MKKTKTEKTAKTTNRPTLSKKKLRMLAVAELAKAVGGYTCGPAHPTSCVQ